ncbi:MAG: glycosyltransferase family 4 protein [Candidatus Woesearchaeota archaeon]
MTPLEPKLKLLVVADTYYPKVDGILRFMEEFIKRSEHDFDLSLLVPNLGLKKGNKVTYLETSKFLKVSGYPSIKFSNHNRKIIRESVQNADVVFVQGPALASYLTIKYAHRCGKPVVFYAHIIIWELFEKFLPKIFNKFISRLIRRINIKLYNKCGEILVPYHELKHTLVHNGVTVPISVAKLGVDIVRFSPVQDKKPWKIKFGIDPEKTVIGYVGRISKEKNVPVLLEAFNKLRNRRNNFLLMVGDGPDEQVQPFKENSQCLVTGFVDNVEDYLKAMDVFVMPSLTETTSLATLEAMSSGLPVVVTKVGFQKQYVVKDYNGLFFPKNSPSLLALKIERILRHSELKSRLSQNARKTISYSFSWERSINHIKRLLKKHKE